MERIDFVLTWVDGSDPEWQKKRHAYDSSVHRVNVETHYRDWGTLKYWFRAVERFAPWVKKIHFVTCGQRPSWLNSNHPKLHLVDHDDFIPSEYLPTFSANPIELNLHRIKDLSERFVYFNDDTFISAPMTEKDFFVNGLPCDSATFASLIPSVKGEVITYILFNDLLLINSNFCKRASLKGNLHKWINLKYGKDAIKNMYYLPIGKFSGFDNPHLPNAYLKSTFEEVWTTEGEFLDSVCRNRFRTNNDVNQYLMRYWRLVKGEFVPRSSNIGRCYTIGDDNAAIENLLIHQERKMICINDNIKLYSIDEQMQWINGVLSKAFPDKSTFEL